MATSTLTKIDYTQLTELMRFTLATDAQPVMLLGGPGTAKTSWTRTLPALLAEVRGIDPADVGLVEFNTGQRDAVEVNGLGLPAKEESGRWTTQFSRSALIQQILDTGKDHGVLNLDEITQCGPDMQKSLRSVLDSDTRTSGGDPIPAGWIVVATGNRLSDKSDSKRPLSHVANACLRFEIDFNFDGWRDWAIADDMDPLLIACVEACHERGLFVDAVPSEDIQFCTPRSFSRLARNLKQMAAANDGVIPDNILSRKLAEATIGRAATDMVMDFVALHDKVPSGSAIQSDPTGALLPDETDLQFIAANVALSTAECSESADRAFQYIVRLRPDLQIGTGAALQRKSVRAGWTCVGQTVSKFNEQYGDLLPLTV